MGIEPKNRYHTGIELERRALAYFLEYSTGAQLIVQNYRCYRGEIDFVIREGRVLVFVEVRTRSGDTFDGVESFSQKKIQSFLRACQQFISRYHGNETEIRMDLMTYDGKRKIWSHEKDFFGFTDFGGHFR